MLKRISRLMIRVLMMTALALGAATMTMVPNAQAKGKEAKRSWLCTCQLFSDANKKDYSGEWSETICAWVREKAEIDAQLLCERETNRVNCKHCGCSNPAKRRNCV